MMIPASIVKRTITILTVGPTVLVLILVHPYMFALLVWGLTLAAMLEWTALKRHLLVNLLLFSNSDTTLASSSSSSSTHNTPNSSSSSSSSVRKPTDEEKDVVVFRKPCVEYAYPVAKTNLFIVCKCVASSLVCVGAVLGVEPFHLGMFVYFVFWMLFTLIGRNRAESAAESAIQRLLASGAALVRNKQQQQLLRPSEASAGAAAQEKHQELQLDDFHQSELHMLSKHFTTHIFLSFCLEYFGFVWVCGLSYATLLYYHCPLVLHSAAEPAAAAAPPQRQMMGAFFVVAVLVSNWANDIMALIVGTEWM